MTPNPSNQVASKLLVRVDPILRCCKFHCTLYTFSKYTSFPVPGRVHKMKFKLQGAIIVKCKVTEPDSTHIMILAHEFGALYFSAMIRYNRLLLNSNKIQHHILPQHPNCWTLMMVLLFP